MTDNQMITEVLTSEERVRLVEYEQQIEHGLDALWRINQEGLWREHGSFQNYVEQRWNFSRRRANQLTAGMNAADTLQRALPQGTPVPENEYALRPIASLSPDAMVETYTLALTYSNGDAPSHKDMTRAKADLSGKNEAALRQLEASEYPALITEASNGGEPVKLLALADALDACLPEVRKAALKANLHDRALIRALNENFRNGGEGAAEVLATGYLQFADGGAVKLADATMRDWRRYQDERFREHQQAARDARGGEPVSVVVYNGQAQRTYESLSAVLDRKTLDQLADIIFEAK